MTFYERSLKQEVYTELIWGIDGFVFRNYTVINKEIPQNIEELRDEALNIYRSFTAEDTEEKLERDEHRIVEIRDYIKSVTPLPHR
ncbi:MAG: hypothetical protein ACI4JY_09820 [Oscillospiraceae bacterium]